LNPTKLHFTGNRSETNGGGDGDGGVDEAADAEEEAHDEAQRILATLSAYPSGQSLVLRLLLHGVFSQEWRALFGADGVHGPPTAAPPLRFVLSRCGFVVYRVSRSRGSDWLLRDANLSGAWKKAAPNPSGNQSGSCSFFPMVNLGGRSWATSQSETAFCPQREPLTWSAASTRLNREPT